MSKLMKETIHAKGIEIGIYTTDYENEFISLTDIAKYRNTDDPRFVIQNWMRNRNTIEFLGVWEHLHNPDFNRVQFEAVKSESGLNRFVMTPSKWIERCDRRYNLLVRTTAEERELIQNKKPKLFLYGASDDLSELYFENSDGESVVYKNTSSVF